MSQKSELKPLILKLISFTSLKALCQSISREKTMPHIVNYFEEHPPGEAKEEFE